MTQVAPKSEALPGDLDGLFDEPVNKVADPVAETPPEPEPANPVDKADGDTPTEDSFSPDKYEKSTQKILEDGKVVEKEYYHVDGVFVGYVDEVQKAEPANEQTPQPDAMQAIISSLRKIGQILKQHDERLSLVADVAKSAKETADRTVLVDARGLDDSFSALAKSGDNAAEPEKDVFAGLLPQLEQMAAGEQT